MITISKGTHIKEILSKGKKSVHSAFIALYKENQLGYPRFAFVVSKKVSKRAVDRNRAKRLLRELVRKYVSYIEGVSCDIVFVLRKKALSKKLQDIEPEFVEFLKKLKDDCKSNNQLYKAV